ncbi:hypothetical protein LXL04_008974 [Taraxacum kok-saghyz]
MSDSESETGDDRVMIITDGDVKTIFLNWKLDEDVYMAQPEGFIDNKHSYRVCKLERSIYGLKQASPRWNLCFQEKVKEYGFSRCEYESCEYVKANRYDVVEDEMFVVLGMFQVVTKMMYLYNEIVTSNQ